MRELQKCPTCTLLPLHFSCHVLIKFIKTSSILHYSERLKQDRQDTLLQDKFIHSPLIFFFSHVIVLGDINTSHQQIDHCDPSDIVSKMLSLSLFFFWDTHTHTHTYLTSFQELDDYFDTSLLSLW